MFVTDKKGRGGSENREDKTEEDISMKQQRRELLSKASNEQRSTNLERSVLGCERSRNKSDDKNSLFWG